MTDYEFKDLLHRYTNNNTSERESFVVESYLERFQKDGLSETDIKYNLDVKNRIYSNILKHKKKATVFNFRNIAAAVLLCITSSILFNIISSKTEFIEVVAQRGEQTKVLLNDSSVVYLNSGSTLKYPKAFAKNARVVTLEGEAFFKVKSNPEKPFIVTSNAFETKVLGTQFVISNYKNVTPSVTVSSGKVKVTNKNDTKNSLVLIKNERVKLSSLSEGLIKEHVQAKNYTTWIDGSLVFNKANLVEVVNMLNQKYSKTIKITSETYSECTISGTYKDKSLNDILESLHFIYDIEFKYIDNKTIELIAKPCKN
ncbi:FecR family protein [Formosa sp. PL04]|uniref:FecR family protein n=1 Tax=Formosa sp. PL04 TaxID=3081755 RepID=UPI0029826FB9|nr:FecR domain-containing protein [Formosa sp. PL04]MDW5290160.1 FecR domain-containing protein [Formosa sp. PL04]